MLFQLCEHDFILSLGASPATLTCVQVQGTEFQLSPCHHWADRKIFPTYSADDIAIYTPLHDIFFTCGSLTFLTDVQQAFVTQLMVLLIILYCFD